MRWIAERMLWSRRDKLVRVKSWWPSIGPYGIEWPTLLVDRLGRTRVTETPVWNRAMVKHFLFGRSED